MIQYVIRQMWNRRRANAWIFVELVLVTFFMWGVIDPVYVLLSNRAIDPGYDIDHVFRLTLAEHAKNHSRYNPEYDTDSIRNAGFMHIYELVRRYPGVESVTITKSSQHPMSNSESSFTLRRDSLEAGALSMAFYQKGDYFKVFGIKDARTGEAPEYGNHHERMVYLTKNLSAALFPEGEAVGKEVLRWYRENDSVYYRVAGVVSDFKFRSAEQPRMTAFIPEESFKVSSSSHICFRIRSELSEPLFAGQFKSELASRLSVGNLYFLQLTSFRAIYRQMEFAQGVTNKLRLQTGLAAFFLLCTFLGIAGTFWLRSNARRGEIGLRMALGSSRSGILREFLAESWLITTVAWLIGVVFVLQRVYYTGFAEKFFYQTDAYIQNRFVPHFLIVSFIVYILILFIALLGTYIPAWRASKTEPAEALRDE